MGRTQENIEIKETAATIAAVSTPAGISGLAVIRISGPDAGLICDQLFHPVSSRFKKASQMEAYSLGVGYWHDLKSGQLVDQVVLSCFRGPNSYTGEDVYEVSCHGSPYVREAILASLLAAGAQAAGPGEFSRRAFINGKLDLAEAEAVMDMIASESSRQNQVALRQLRGQLSDSVTQLREDFYQVLGQIEMIIEFPEHEDSPQNRDDIFEHLSSLAHVLEDAVASFRQGRVVREGFQVVIAGRPNVGKSSLLNALVGADKAIVTDQAGTTRDIIEAQIIIDGLAVNLTDTAGLRTTSDLVEREGISRAKDAVDKADLIFYLFSPEDPTSWADDLTQVETWLGEGKELVLLAAKEDLAGHADLVNYLQTALAGREFELLTFSRYQKDRLQEVKDQIIKSFNKLGQTESDAILITHFRHKQVLSQSLAHVQEAISALRSNIPLDLVSGLLRAGAEDLAEITGDEVSEELIERIFSEFCVGK